MATQLEGTARRPRMRAALLALALTLAVVGVIMQASSVWSTRTVPPAQPAPVQSSLGARELRALSKDVVLLPKGCRVKYGCSGGASSEQG